MVTTDYNSLRYIGDLVLHLLLIDCILCLDSNDQSSNGLKLQIIEHVHTRNNAHDNNRNSSRKQWVHLDRLYDECLLRSHTGDLFAGQMTSGARPL